jgi:hypothetical protein
MIIKTTLLATAAGSEQTRNHIAAGDENLAIVVVEGTQADIDNAFTDARAAGKVNALRHVVLAPREPMTQLQMLWALAMYEVEFGLKKRDRLFVAFHQKQRVDDDCYDWHLHALYRHWDVETGKVGDDSNTFPRGEAVARRIECSFDHPFVNGKHTPWVIRYLRKQKHFEVANALASAFSPETPKPKASISAGVSQRMKSLGVNASEKRKQVRIAFYDTPDNDGGEAFRARLAEHSMLLAVGDRQPPGWIVLLNGPSGPEFLFSLVGCLPGQRDNVDARLGAPNVVRNLAAAPAATAIAAADAAATAAPPEPAPERDRRRIGRRLLPAEYAPPSRTEQQQGDPARLKRDRGNQDDAAGSRRGQAGTGRGAKSLIRGLIANKNLIQQIAQLASENAEMPRDRVLRLVENLERGARAPIQAYEAQQPEPLSLIAARAAVRNARTNMETLHNAALKAVRATENHKSATGSVWDRATGKHNARLVALEAQERRYTKGLDTYRSKLITAKLLLEQAEAAHKSTLAKRAADLLPAASDALINLKIASEIKSMIHRDPMIVRRGFFDLYVMARMLHEAKIRHRVNAATSEQSAPDLRQITDIWGVGQLPKP